MDIDKALREFANSDQPLRQTREEMGLALTIGLEEGEGRRCCPAKARNLSKGGIGADISAEYADLAERLIPGCEASLEICWPEEPHSLSVNAEVVWLCRGKQGHYLIGFRYVGLCKEAQEQVERCILSQIIRRHSEDDRSE